MARIRTIKPEFWDDEKLSLVSRDARLTFIGMWTFSDDYGVVKGASVWLKSKIFPYDNIQFEQFDAWITELRDLGLISGFSHIKENFYYIINFSKHQKIDKPSKFRNPIYCNSLLDSPNTPLPVAEDSALYKEEERDMEEDKEIVKEKELAISSSKRKDVISVAEFVFLTQKEIDRLRSEFGEKGYESLVARLDNYKGQTKKNRNKYDDDNRAIRGWILKEYKKESGGGDSNSNRKNLN